MTGNKRINEGSDAVKRAVKRGAKANALRLKNIKDEDKKDEKISWEKHVGDSDYGMTKPSLYSNKVNENKLSDWAIEFEEKHGRKPTNKDLKIKNKREISVKKPKKKSSASLARRGKKYAFISKEAEVWMNSAERMDRKALKDAARERKAKLDEVAKWRKTSAKVETGNDDYPGNDYGGKWKSIADTPTKWGSIHDRKPGKLKRDGKITPRSASGLKARIRANLGKK